MKQGAHKFNSLLLLGLLAGSYSYGAAAAAGGGADAQVKKIAIPALADDDAKVKMKVVVQLAGEGDSGYTEILQKRVLRDGTYEWRRIDKCGSSNSYESRGGDDPAFKTPAGRFQPLDTSNKLLYKGDWDEHGPATYYIALQANADENRRAFAAIHNGHRPGRNSHGCVRTEDDCADQIREYADGLAVAVAADAEGVTPKSLIFSPIEERLFSRSLGIKAKARRDFSAMVLEFLDY